MFGYLSEKLSGLTSFLGSRSKVTEENIKLAILKLQEILIGADVPFKTAKYICDKVRLDLADVKKNSKVSLDDRVKTLLYNTLLSLLGGGSSQKDNVNFKNKGVFLFAGLQGSGKTTTIAKIANFLCDENKNYKIACTSLDFVRPAAIEQLEILAKRVGINFLPPVEKNWEKTVVLAKEIFKTGGYDFLFVDTPGRLHLNNALMKELQDINLMLDPTYKFLVIDSMTGQESLNVAKAFNDVINIDGAVLSKTDSDSKGGAAIAFYSELQKPIVFMGTGENIKDLEYFVPSRIVSRIMGGGDIETLMEKISKEVSQEDKIDHEKMEARFKQGKSDLQDFLSQLELMSSFGSVQKLLGYLPKMGNIPDLSSKIVTVEADIKKAKSAILSMTPAERQNPKLINFSRKTRIARGAGILTTDVDDLLNKFEQSKQFARMMNKGWKN